MTTVGLTALEAIRRFAKTLRRSPFSFQLGHDRLLILWPCSQARPKNLAIPLECRYRRDDKLFLGLPLTSFFAPTPLSSSCLPSPGSAPPPQPRPESSKNP